MVTEHQMSERHACALVGLSRDSYLHDSKTSTLNVELQGKIVEAAHAPSALGLPHDSRRSVHPVPQH